MKLEDIQEEIYNAKDLGENIGTLSDSYHTFNDLYLHRCVLSAAFFRQIPFTWKSKLHEDGTMFDGMFIVGAATPEGMISYHYDLPDWDLFKVPEIPHAPVFDGHTPEQVVDRIKEYFTRGILRYNEEELEQLNPVVQSITDCFEDDNQVSAYIKTFIK